MLDGSHHGKGEHDERDVTMPAVPGSGFVVTFTSRTILPVPSTMQMLVTLTDRRLDRFERQLRERSGFLILRQLRENSPAISNGFQ